MVFEKQQGTFAFTESAFDCLFRTFFFIKDAGQYFIAFLSLCILIKLWNIKRLNFSANYMPEGTLTMQVSMLC